MQFDKSGNDILNGAGNIKNPITLADMLLENGYTSGIITIPFLKDYDFSVKEEPKLMSIPFYTHSNFNFSLQNEWGEIVSSDITGAFSQMLNQIVFAANTLTGGTIKSGNLQSKIMQAASWKSSKIPTFSIDTVFISTNRTINPVAIVQALAAGALPSEHSEAVEEGTELGIKATGVAVNIASTGIEKATSYLGVDSSSFTSSLKKSKEDLDKNARKVMKTVGMTAPFGYSIAADYSKDNPELVYNSNRMCSLNIGRWFSAGDLLIDSIPKVEFSKEVVAPRINSNSIENWIGAGLNTGVPTADDPWNASSYPLYAECTISFRPRTIITAKDFAKYFNPYGYNFEQETAATIVATE